jgi:glycolate oxidase
VSMIAMPEPDRSVLRRRDAIVRELVRLVGAEQVIADRDGRRAFETDGLSAYRCMPLAVVLARSTDDVSKVLAYAHAIGIKVIARGAGTSLSGGALPTEDSIVLGLSRMNRVLSLDYDNRTARVEAGITTSA